MAEPASERYPPRTICRLSAAMRCAPMAASPKVTHASFQIIAHMLTGLRAAVCGTSTSSTLPSIASSFEKIATRSAIAQLGIQGIAERVAEQTEAENSERDRKTRKDGDPWRRRGVFLGASLQHQAPCRRRFLHAEPKIGQRRLRQDRLGDEGGQQDQKP